jgi:hypothetical protein
MGIRAIQTPDARAERPQRRASHRKRLTQAYSSLCVPRNAGTGRGPERKLLVFGLGDSELKYDRRAEGGG